MATISKLIENDVTGGNKIEKQFYDTEARYDLHALIYDGRLNLAKALAERFAFRGNVLEMGSGHSWLTAEISKLPGVQSSWCLDLSDYLLKEAAPQVFRMLGANEEKITRVVSSFYHVPCPDQFFDYVIFESSFHHVPDYAALFAELKRILKPDGIVICTRERVVKEGKCESEAHFLDNKKSGILERIFTISEYRFLAELNHFHFTTEPFFWYPSEKKQFKHMVKMLFSKLPGPIHKRLAKRFNSQIFIMRKKAFDVIAPS